MEFYKIWACRSAIISSVSIPNGMEFYDSLEIRAFRMYEFQFPTGWNSTVCLLSRGISAASFNSQRDGILLSRVFRKRQQILVSIPNGMEFYPVLVLSFVANRAFQFPTGWNSTGLNVGGRAAKRSVFQFPTGWNSTGLNVGGRAAKRSVFQFPTGWNSTLR